MWKKSPKWCAICAWKMKFEWNFSIDVWENGCVAFNTFRINRNLGKSINCTLEINLFMHFKWETCQINFLIPCKILEKFVFALSSKLDASHCKQRCLTSCIHIWKVQKMSVIGGLAYSKIISSVRKRWAIFSSLFLLHRNAFHQ